MTHQICNACETVAHCMNHGCIPVRPRRAPGLENDDGSFTPADELNAMRLQPNLQLNDAMLAMKKPPCAKEGEVV